MTHFLTTLSLATGLALASLTLVSAHTPPRAGNVDVLVDGKARPVYWHGGRWYVEALEGEEYAIRLRNPFGVRTAVALSVDGLNTIDGRDTTARAARKWVLQPYQTVTIRGWQTSQRTARRFEFTTEARSYGAALGKTENLGIISAAFFKERIETAAPLALEDSRLRRDVPAAPAAGPREESASKQSVREADASMAATGMGRETDHAVTHVRLDLEETPAAVVSLRYEFRPQLVKLGVLSAPHEQDALARRERARGFDAGFAPVPRAFDR
jgi:hypothetical protein